MKITISTIQADLFWEDKSSNLKMFESAFEQVSHDSKLVIIPEMFSTGFSMMALALSKGYSPLMPMLQAMIFILNFQLKETPFQGL